jgi:hypothetical protein
VLQHHRPTRIHAAKQPRSHACVQSPTQAGCTSLGGVCVATTLSSVDLLCSTHCPTPLALAPRAKGSTRHNRKHVMNECERTTHTPQRGSADCTHPSQPLLPPEVAFLPPTGIRSTVESNGRIHTCCDAHPPCAQRTMHTQWPTQARLNVRTSSVMAAAAAPAASGSAMSVARSWLCKTTVKTS